MDKKSPDAFRTISEVADWLGVPTHVLRFWESRFTHVKPVKRAGGRRYYRPADMVLLGGIRKLLHEDGMTIRGVQKLLRENGIKHVAAMSPPLESNEMRKSDGSNVVPLTAAQTTTETSDEAAPQAAEEDSADIVDAHTDNQEGVDETPVFESEPEVADHGSPPTLADAADEAPEEPAERNLFSAEVAPEPETVEMTSPELDPAVPEHNEEPTELDADISASHTTEEVEAPVDEDTVFNVASSQNTRPAEPDTVTEPNPAPESLAPIPPTPIDISHVAADRADDAFTSSPNASASAQLRALRASGGTLPNDTLHSLTARLSDLAARMAPALSDNGQAE